MTIVFWAGAGSDTISGRVPAADEIDGRRRLDRSMVAREPDLNSSVTFAAFGILNGQRERGTPRIPFCDGSARA